MYQHNSVLEIGNIIEQNARGIERQVMLDRLFTFVEHLQREDHVDDAQHQAQVDSLEGECHANNAGPRKNECPFECATIVNLQARQCALHVERASVSRCRS